MRFINLTDLDGNIISFSSLKCVILEKANGKTNNYGHEKLCYNLYVGAIDHMDSIHTNVCDNLLNSSIAFCKQTTTTTKIKEVLLMNWI